MEAVRVRHVSLPAVKRAKNSDKIVEDKGGEEGGKTRNRGGRKAKIDGGEMSHVDFTERRWPLTFRAVSACTPLWSLNSC